MSDNLAVRVASDIAKEELRLRQEDFMELLKDHMEIDLDRRGDMEGNEWLEVTLYWNDGTRSPISSSTINLPGLE